MSDSDKNNPPLERLFESQVTRRDLLKRGAGLAGAAALAGSLGNVLSACGSSGGNGDGSSTAGVTINWLTWPGHGIPAVLDPFEKQTGIKVQVKEYSSGDLGLTEM
ncbi:MAG: twin-arginine translocation signal domain-containing protein, partial [Thermoleophilia bacterium]